MRGLSRDGPRASASTPRRARDGQAPHGARLPLSHGEGSALAAPRHPFEAGPCKNGSQQTMVDPIITWGHLRYRRDAMERGMVTA